MEMQPFNFDFSEPVNIGLERFLLKKVYLHFDGSMNDCQ